MLVRAAGGGETQPGVREAGEGRGQLAARFALLEVVVGRTRRVYQLFLENCGKYKCEILLVNSIERCESKVWPET